MGKNYIKKQLPSVPMALLCPVIVVFKFIAAMCQLLNNEDFLSQGSENQKEPQTRVFL